MQVILPQSTVLLFPILFNFVIAFPLARGQSGDTNGPSNLSENNSKFQIRLGSLFTIYGRDENERCDENNLLPLSVESAEMALHAIDQINKNPTILPGVELILNLTADCWIDTIALHRVVELYSGRCSAYDINGLSSRNRYWGLIGPYTSGVAVPVSKLLGLFDFPQISCGATSSDLSDKQRFPSFFRTVPSDTHQIKAIIKLLERNGWHYVSFIHEDDDYGNAAFDAFEEQIRNTSICTAQEHKLKRNLSDLLLEEVVRKLTEDTKSNVVIGFVFEERIRNIFRKVFQLNLAQRFQWIGSDAWASLIYNNCSTESSNTLDSEINPVLDGTMFFQLHTSNNENFENYLRRRTIAKARKNNRYFAYYIASKHNCSLEDPSNLCPDNLTLPEDPNSMQRSSSCPNTVYAYAHALDTARKQLCGEEELCDEFKNMNGSQLIQYLRSVSFLDDYNSTFSFDSSHDGSAWYDILRYNATSGCWNKIGEYTEANGLVFTDEEVAGGRGNVESTCSNPCDNATQFRVLHETQTCCWHCLDCPNNAALNMSYVPSSTGTVDEGCFTCNNNLSFPKMDEQVCVLLPAKFLSFEHPLAWAVAIASSVGFALTLFAGGVYAWFWNTPLIRASGRELSTLILVGVFFIFAVSFLFCVKPTDVICGARRFGIGFSFSLVFSGLLVKTIRISVVFNDLGKRLVRDYKLILKPTPQIVLALLLTSIEGFVLVAWFLYMPPQMIETATRYEANSERYRSIDCTGMKSQVFLVGLGYPILLFLVCTYYAIKIRKVPAGFNEAKFIGFAVYTTLVIWLAQLSTYFVQITAEIVLRDAIYCMCLSLNALIILLALFGPKVYIALLRPEKNNQATVMASNRHLTTPLASSLAKTNSVKHDGGYFENGQRSRNSSVQLNPNMYLEVKHCPCCPLHHRQLNGHSKDKTLPLISDEREKYSVKPPPLFEITTKSPEKNENDAQPIEKIVENSINLDISNSQKLSNSLTSQNLKNNEPTEKILNLKLLSQSDFEGKDNPVFEHESSAEKQTPEISTRSRRKIDSCETSSDDSSYQYSDAF